MKNVYWILFSIACGVLLGILNNAAQLTSTQVFYSVAVYFLGYVQAIIYNAVFLATENKNEAQ